MTNIQIMNQASDLMSAWNGDGFFMQHYINVTGNDIDTKAYELVYEMLTDGML